ncbi:DUF4838 domain-containing protein [Romboutsia weinsteinii]|uniref:DUF4838 domain-containing protein n=1 Tax=Romboutsia weinsteinii TaxID=2020949 RepID=A0A371J3Q6_9FIRM|nr:DUF4838 domain-containing protein [Romboutsia weinsteinii]RDY27306.1 DUF4838 domain-containing protein [Romboutsia weinsteinii]
MNVKLYLNKKDQVSKFAIEELKDYLKRIDSASEILVTEKEEEASILLIINDKLNEEVDENVLDEVIDIKIKDGKGSISGNNSRALLLAVYRFLDEIGCKFLRPGKKHEWIPSVNLDKVSVELLENPSFRHRGVCIEGSNSVENIFDFIDWLPKVGFNSFFIQFENPYSFLKRWYEHEFNPYMKKEPFSTEIAQKMSDKIDKEIEKRNLLHHRVGHGWTSETLGYSSKYGWETGVELTEESREYAAELSGKRDLFNQAPILTSLCFSNQKVMEKMTDVIVDYAKEHKSVDYLHVWLSDARNNICECSECQKEIPADQYVQLLNLLDEKLQRENLNTKICFLLYHELLFAPLHEKINNPDRYVMMFAPITRTFEKSYADVDYKNDILKTPKYIRNQVVLPNSLEENLSYLFEWKNSFNGDSFVYDYPLGRAHYGDMGYIAISKVIYRDIQYLNNLGLNGYISCQELRAGFPHNFPNYVMGKMLWNKTIDYNELKKDYFQAAYGPNWESVYRYLEKLSNLSSCDYFNSIGDRINSKMDFNYRVVGEICKEFLPEIKRNIIDSEGIQNEFWEVLAYHREYSVKISEGLSYLCCGKKQEAQDVWEELLNFIRINEKTYQSYLDVYRLIEVAKNYAGFLLKE